MVREADFAFAVELVGDAAEGNEAVEGLARGLAAESGASVGVNHPTTKAPRDDDPAATVLLYSAHSLPVSTIEKRKDPYPRQIEATCALIDERLGRRFRSRLGYQSKLGPIAWLGPSTNEVLAELAREGAKQVLVCPVAFVSDHVETLYEIRMLFADEARALGIPVYAAVDGLNDHPAFIEALADVSRKALLPGGSG